MKANDILVEEHKIILVVIDVLEKIAKEAKLDKDDALLVIDFIKNFADKCHHSKEEDILFGYMEAHGFPQDGGPTGVMLMEHKEGRRFVGGMSSSLEEAVMGDKDSIENFVSNAHGYINLLKQHIQKENDCLYPMADDAIPADVADEILEKYLSVEKEAGGKRHKVYFEKAKKLADKYNVTFLDDASVPTLQEYFL